VKRSKALRPATAAAVASPNTNVSVGRRKHHVATSVDPTTQVGFLSVYDGQVCVGHLLPRGKTGVEAFDRDDKSLGIYPDQKAAAGAVSKVAGGAYGE
jgi:hypothetical protein